jgi:hypothetical protein
LLLIVDGSSIYTSKSTRQWLTQRPQVVLVPLPSYAPRLNVQAQIWRWLRADVIHNHFFATFTALIDAAESFFAQLGVQPEAVLHRFWRLSLTCWSITLQTFCESHEIYIAGPRLLSRDMTTTCVLLAG